MRQRTINQGWRFRKDSESEAISVTLPHDAMILEAQDPALENGAATGFYPGGRYEYRKTLHFTADETAGTVIAEFEGVYMNARVFLNGEELGGHIYGYTDFYVNLTGKVLAGENELLVVADNFTTPNSRWYSGSGIYRSVHLWTGGKDCILPDGIRVKTISADPTVIEVTTEVTGGDESRVDVEILKDGQTVASGEGRSCRISIPDAQLWSAEKPELYTVRATLRNLERGDVLDTAQIRTGFRMISWNGGEGLLINGKSVKLRGGCIHHDHGILGAASNDESEYRRVKRLKEFGYNAIRYSHNPAGKNFLRACDELGMYVIDEAFDQWKVPQTAHDYSTVFDQEWQGDIRALTRKDYSHPCVIMYGIGNEITDTGLSFGGQIAAAIHGFIKSLDDSRPTMIAFNSMLCMIAHMKEEQQKAGKDSGRQATSQDANEMVTLLAKIKSMITPENLLAIIGPSAEAVDIVGLNYGTDLLEGLHAIHPDWTLLNSETFPSKIGENWETVQRLPYVAGDFHWTAWDYLGEAGVGLPTYGTEQAPFSKGYPCRLASCGAFDLNGFPETAAWYNAILWGAKQGPYIAVRPLNHAGEPYTLGRWRLTDSVPCWTWPGTEGKTAEIEICAAGESTELFLNETSLGRKPLESCIARFSAPYQPGTLRAVSYDADGRKIAEQELMTANTTTAVLHVLPEEKNVRPGGLLYVPVCLQDAQGNLMFTERRDVHVSISGAGELIALGSADPESTGRFDQDHAWIWHGQVLAVVRAGENPGTIAICASTEGLPDAEETVEVKTTV